MESLPPPHPSRDLGALGGADSADAARLVGAVAKQLRALAARFLKREAPGVGLQTTDLVQGTWLALLSHGEVTAEDRGRFLGLAATVMRQVLVDEARNRKALKRGGGWRRVEIADTLAVSAGPRIEILDLDEALDRLTKLHPRQARVVELRFFAGLDGEEVAAILDVSPRTVDGDWTMARAWLHRELSREAKT